VIFRDPVVSPLLRTDTSGGNFDASRLCCTTTITWMSSSVVGNNGKTTSPILHDRTMPATGVMSVDPTTIPVSDYPPTSQNFMDKIRRPDGSFLISEKICTFHNISRKGDGRMDRRMTTTTTNTYDAGHSSQNYK